MKTWQQTLARALERQWRRYRQALKRCQRDFSESSIHDSRIEARRLAAQLEFLAGFAPRAALEKAQRALKRHLDTFDPLRDAQVQLCILKKQCGHIDGAKAVRKLTACREKRCRRKAECGVRKVKTKRVEAFIDPLVKLLKAPAALPAGRLTNVVRRVDKAFAQTVRCRHRINPADAATIHRTRVAFKKFRYMMESMHLLFPEVTARQLAVMQRFQGVLGDLQDTDVFLGRVDKLIEKRQLKAEETAPFRRWLVLRRKRQINRCLQRADMLFEFWPLNSAKPHSLVGAKRRLAAVNSDSSAVLSGTTESEVAKP